MNRLNYRYTYGLEKLSVILSPVDTAAGSIVQNGTVKLYYHRDRLGNTDYLTDNIQAKPLAMFACHSRVSFPRPCDLVIASLEVML